MGRLARVVAAGIPHHITQRGNRRQQTFFCEDDYREYIPLMAEWCFQYAIEVWALGILFDDVTSFGGFVAINFLPPLSVDKI